MKVIRILPPALLFALLFTACSPFIQPEIKDWQFQEASFVGDDSIQVNAFLIVNNPNAYSLQFYNADCFVILDDKPSGRAWLDSVTTIQGNGETPVPVTARLSKQNITDLGLKLLLTSSLSYQLTGIAKAGKSAYKKEFPINETGTLDRRDLERLIRF